MQWETIKQTVWDELAAETRPIVLYGMGNGADKILKQFSERKIAIDGVFASDEFVRGHSYAGFRVETFGEITARLGEELVIVVSFASQRPEVMEKIYALDRRYTVVAPDVPVAGEELFDLAFTARWKDEIERAGTLFADSLSRAVYDDMICFKLTGRLHWLRAHESGKEEIFSEVLRPGEEEHFVDLGAYTGDTIRELLSYTNGSIASVVAMEPDRRSFRKLSAWAEETLAGKEVQLIQAGAWNCDTTMPFAARAGRQSAIAKQGVPTEMRAVDQVLAGQPCTMLKMDVEGAEAEALEGAAQTIARYRPRLNIACYHRSRDLFALPLLVHRLCPDYRLYLRHHPYIPAWDVNLYAVAAEKGLEM